VRVYGLDYEVLKAKAEEVRQIIARVRPQARRRPEGRGHARLGHGRGQPV